MSNLLESIGREPTSAGSPDSVDAVLEQMEVDLRSQLRGRVAHVRLELHPDGLVLHGRARTYYAKLLAQHALMEASDLPIAANEIEVC
jgi:hypothetical protein